MNYEAKITVCQVDVHQWMRFNPNGETYISALRKTIKC